MICLSLPGFILCAFLCHTWCMSVLTFYRLRQLKTYELDALSIKFELRTFFVVALLHVAYTQVKDLML
jgi:hypothetical protein